MKFLCVKCDDQMLLKQTLSHREQGSLSVVFYCPKCSQQTAMLTNPGETQLLQSLGIALGRGEGRGENGGEAGKGRCPFAASHNTLVEGALATGPEAGPRWTADALERLANVPEMVRPMAKMGVEKFAAERGLTQIDADLLDQARESFGL